METIMRKLRKQILPRIQHMNTPGGTRFIF
jgi:hypothetical protein